MARCSSLTVKSLSTKTRHNNPGIETFTSLSVHDEQLTPAELFAYISVEISSNLNFMAEARKRPRPSQLGKLAETDDHDDLRDGFAGDRVKVNDEDPDSGGAEAQDGDMGMLGFFMGMRMKLTN